MLTAIKALLAGLIFTSLAAQAAPALAHDGKQGSAGNLVMFLTHSDPMVAGHGLHFATHMAKEGRGATIVLVGDAGRLALKDWPADVSAVSGEALNADLEAFIAAGGRVYVTPYTLESFNATPADLIAGATPPDDPEAIHNHMFASDTQLLVW